MQLDFSKVWERGLLPSNFPGGGEEEWLGKCPRRESCSGSTITGYTLAFGSLLMEGGRLGGDVLRIGRSGWAAGLAFRGLSRGSLPAGLAQWPIMLIIGPRFRAGRGRGR